MHYDNLFQKTAKANPVYPVTLPTAKYPSLPGVDGPRTPPRVKPARCAPEDETTEQTQTALKHQPKDNTMTIRNPNKTQ